MPKISVYENPEKGLTPDDRGIGALSSAARRSGQLFDEAASAGESVAKDNARMVNSSIQGAGEVAVSYVDHQQISHGAAALAAFTEQKTKAWDDTLKGYTDADGTVHPPANPNDPDVARRFREKMEPELEKLQETFWTENSRKWATSQIGSIRNHFNTKTTADMGTLAADAVSVNYKTVQNTLSNTAMTSPDAVPALIEQARAGIAGIVASSPNLRGVNASHATTKLTEATVDQIVKAGAIGAIRKSANPEAVADEWAAKYPQYISGAEIKQLADAARQQMRFMRAEQRADQAEQRRADTDNFHRAANQWEMSTTRTDPQTGAVVPVTPPGLRESLTNIVNMPNAEPSRVAAMVARAERIGLQQDESSVRNLATRSRATQANLFEQTVNGQVQNKSVYRKAYVDGNLTWEAMQQLERNFDQDRSETGQPVAARRHEVIQSVEALIDPARTSLGSKSAAGSQALDQYGQWLRGKEEEARKAGKSPQSIYEYTGPNGTGPSIAVQGARQFAVSATQAMQSRIKEMTGGAAGKGNLTGPGKTTTGVEVIDVPAVGFVRGDWTFKGGDPSKQTNWEKKK